MDDHYERAAEAYLAKLQSAVADGGPTPHECQRLFEDFLAVAEAPCPDPYVLHYFYTSGVLIELAEALFVPFSERLRVAIDRITASDTPRSTESYLRIRPLSPRGLYPNLEVSSGRAQYVIRAGKPYLITQNSTREDAKWMSFSELSDWTRHEVRLSAALCCSDRYGFTAYLGSRFHDFPLRVLAAVERPARVTFMVEYLGLVDGVQKGEWSVRSRALASDLRFEWYDSTGSIRAMRAFAAGFLISHPLLLRTAQNLVKSSMLWRTDGFAEDALMTLMFALEGCLLLFQDARGLRTDRLDRKALREIFTKTYVYGDSLYAFIEDALGWGRLRARLVHPQLAMSGGWSPEVMADDYFEYHQVVRALLTHLATGGTFEDFPLK